MGKKSLRQHFSTLRKNIPISKRQEYSQKASSHMLQSHEWQQADNIFLFASMQDEIDTMILIQVAWATGKQIFLPRCDKKKKGKMEFIFCPNMSCLQPGVLGILEPKELYNTTIDTTPDIIITPGLAFTLQGHRLGMGGGYYDRILAKYNSIHTKAIGFCYDIQITDKLPHENWDIPVHGVCTNKEFTWFS